MSRTITNRNILSFVLFFVVFNSWSQNSPLKTIYKTYTELPREVVYLHLNKTTLVKGEDLGFTAYVLDKASKQPSQATKNLYCVVTDTRDSIIKQQLLKVDNGISSGTVKIDSLFTSGNYTVKAYTNYMRNFKERNYFTHQIRVIDPEKEKEIKPQNRGDKKDIQLLPEGGHLIADISNVMGVIIKDSLGFGIGNLEGSLKNGQGKIIITFKVNRLGIGRFLIKPKPEEDYYVDLNMENSEKVPVKDIKVKGIGIQISDLGDKVALTLQINAETHRIIKNTTYTLVIHNGHQIETLPISFSEQEKVTKIFRKTDLFTGINMFTLFNESNQPILERLYFNYEGIAIKASEEKINVTKEKDTTMVTLAYKDIDPNRFNNFSVSVLPTDTKSYGAHHNIISQAYLQPYIKSYIEDAQYYFTEVNQKKQYELDNLLLTQGWSAYSWDDVFNDPPKQEYNFDVGISFKVIPEKQKNQQFLVAVKDSLSNPEVYALSEKDKGFLVANKFPTKNTPIEISRIKGSGKVLSVEDLKLEFYPNTVPNLFKGQNALQEKNERLITFTQIADFNKKTLKDVQQLDEVVVEGKYERTRIDDIKLKNPSRVELLDDEMKLRYFFFEDYISSRGYYFKEDNLGRVQLVNRSVEISFVPSEDSSGGLSEGKKELQNLAAALNKKDPYPTVFIDGMEIRNIELLKDYELRNVDYITINKHRHFYSSKIGGTIHIITKTGIPSIPESIRKITSVYKFPFAFENQKTFYKPKYPTYTSRFFKEYGVIDWLPENSLNEKGELQLKFPAFLQDEVKLFVEGVTKDGIFISEIKSIVLKN